MTAAKMDAMRKASLSVTLTAVVLTTLLAGCATTGEPEAGPTRQAVSPSPSPTPARTPLGAGDGVPLGIGCDQLITAQVMYDYNSNFGLKADYSPQPRTPAAQAVAHNGLACAWVNQTSGELIEVAVADLPAARLSDLEKAAASTGQSVPANDAKGYFTRDESTGEAQLFSGSYWLVATSSSFFEFGDVQQILDAALAALG